MELVVRFAKFEHSSTGRPVYINPSQVVTIRSHGDDENRALLKLSGEAHSMTVVGSADEVVATLSLAAGGHKGDFCVEIPK